MKIIQGLLFCLLCVTSIAAQEIATRYPIIPKPAQLTRAEGTFVINKLTNLSIKPYNEQTHELILLVADYISSSVGEIQGTWLDKKNTIGITIDETLNSPEGYWLSITPDNIHIKAGTTTGAFWAFQTLRQLMPAQAERQCTFTGGSLEVPCVTIVDEPRFAYRGVHLDVARHMFPIDFIKKYIDVLAIYKLNTFHWHLTDDQGWRIEIKKYPKLHRKAAYRDQTLIGHAYSFPAKFDGKPYGGYYTQSEVKEIVEYARKRHITIIPEIELPGHCLAALAAYPELGCTGGPYKTGTTWGVFDDVYCAGNEQVFTFLEDVLCEVIDLFDSTYIHIGGDEVSKKRWKACAKCQARIHEEGLNNEDQLQSYFIARVEKFVNSKGRQIIGWDEILEGGVAPGATIMSWRGIQGGIHAATLNHNVIMTPNEYLYFDSYQTKSEYEPLAIGGYLPLEKVYSYDPIPQQLNDQQARYILGAQANVWTEYIKTSGHVEYMLCPRLMALAEITWSQPSNKNFGDFLQRLSGNLPHVKALNLACADYM